MNMDALQYNDDHFSSHEFAPPPKKRRRKWKWLLLFLILLGAASYTVYGYLAKTNQIFTGDLNIFERLGSLWLSPDKPLLGEEVGQVNVLLLGVGGEHHDGGWLSDTMIVASINTKTSEVVMTSIPRDFAVKLEDYGYNKINAAYAYAYLEDPDTAGDAATLAAEQITGLKIPYYAVVDFKGFVKAVNSVGGLDITIDRTFTDASYPDDRFGFMTPVTFTKGVEHMDGNRALIFARSRQGNNNEGSDFARGERQKKIIEAFKQKVLDLDLTKLTTINNLLSDFTENFRTNLEPHELKRIGDLAKDIGSDKIYSLSLEPQGDLICSALVDPKTGIPVPPPVPPAPPTPPTTPPPITKPTTPTPTPPPTPTPTPVTPEVIRIYVIQPCVGKTLEDIHAWMHESAGLAKLRKEAAVVEIQNSTTKASVVNPYRILSEKGMDLNIATFLGRVDYDQTILYDNSHGSKPNTLEYLKSNYELTVSDVNYTSSTADFVIILGKDSL
jgi:LCP family protein required for cell wall assembly